MSYASTNINSAGLAEDYVGPTIDVWLEESDQLRSRGQTTWCESGLNRWAVPILRNISAFEAVDVAENAILEEVNTDELREFPVILSFPEESAWLLRCIGDVREALAHIPLQERRTVSHQQSCFAPDFFDIRRRARYIMGSTPVSIVEQEQPLESERNVPITIHPEVIREAAEKVLTNDLEISIELAREIYPTLSRIEVNVEHDPEILGRKTIRFTLSVSGGPETILRNEAVFKRQLRSSIGPHARELITITYRWDK